MKKVIASIFVCIMLVSAFLLVSCGNSKVEFKVNFIVDGETYSTINTNGNEVISIPQNPTKEGYTFDGWFWDEGVWQRPFTANSLLNEPLSSDMSVYAKWTEVSAEPEPAPVKPSAEISSSALTVSGETATAMLSNATQTFSFLNDITVADGATYILATDIGCQNTIASKTVALEEGDNTYYILVTNGNLQKLYTVTIRRRPIYTVEFNTNGGTSVETLYVEEDSTIEMQQTSKVGYTFDGWTIDGEQVEFPYQVKKSENIVAKWQACENKLVLDGNGATSGSMDDITINTDKTVLLPTNTFEKTGYSFKGWSTTENGSVAYTDGASYTMGANSSYTLYAVWEANKNTLVFDANGGSGSMSNMTIATDASANLTNNAFTRKGYIFKGWSTTKDGEVEYADGAEYTMGTNSSYTLYAVWETKTNTLVFNANGGSGSMSNMTIATDASANLTTNAFIRKGYTLVGWSTAKDGEVEYADGAEYTMGTNSFYTLYAVWEANEYTITYNKNGGTEKAENPVKFTIEDLPITLNDLSKANYLFNYWYKESDFSESPVLQIVDIGDVELYAEYVECTDGISLTDANGEWTVSAYTGTATDVVIPKSYKGKNVTSIGSKVFCNCNSLTSVTIPDSVTSIGEGAFSGCSSLTSITMGGSVTTIGSKALYNCKSLTSVNYLGEVEQWCNISFDYYANPLSNGAKLYLNGTLVTDLVIPNTVTEIKPYAFYNFTGLTSVTIGNGVTTIGDWAFYGCTGLPSITIPDSVTTIGSFSFYGCPIERATIPTNAISYIPKTKLKTVVINGGDTIKDSAFEDCTSLASITISDSVTTIGKYAFYNCTGLTSITIPDSVTTIGDRAFKGCTGFTSITIPDSVTTIGSSAFYNCTGLTSITIPDSVTTIGDWAFYGCTGLTSVNYLGEVEQWCNISFDYYANPLSNGAKLYLDGTLVTDLVIPNTVTEIKPYAFYNYKSLTSITIPDNVTTIGDYAFYYCTSLTSVTMGGNITSIGNKAFCSCSSLTSITIPDSVTTIGDRAFYGCGLTNITIPDSVTTIGAEAFGGCYSLTIYCEVNSKPSGWDSEWNSSNRPVEWGYTEKQA